MNIFMFFLAVILGICALVDSYTSYKRGVFREYRKMAPSVYYYKGDRSFISRILGTTFLGIIMLGLAIWLWLNTM